MKLLFLLFWCAVSLHSGQAFTSSPYSSTYQRTTHSLTLSKTAQFLSTKEKETTSANSDSSTTSDDTTSLNPKEKMAEMMKPIKEAGVAGAVSLFIWEAAFWIISIPVCSIVYYQTTGSWPDWSNAEDVAKVSAEAFAFANIARFALPLRVGLAVATTPWVQANIIDRFAKKDE
jgi:hypothetical protein